MKGASMWLSDAIRIGCAMKPQAFGDFFRDGGSCALGAAMDGYQSEGAGNNVIYRTQPWELENCPMCSMGDNGRMKNYATYAMIPHLNDYHKMSREEIADLVESWEVKYEGRQAKVKAVVSPVDPLADLFTPVTAELAE